MIRFDFAFFTSKAVQESVHKLIHCNRLLFLWDKEESRVASIRHSHEKNQNVIPLLVDETARGVKM